VCNRQRIEAQSLEENLNEKRLASIGGGFTAFALEKRMRASLLFFLSVA
jgi:hypothetical protein